MQISRRVTKESNWAKVQQMARDNMLQVGDQVIDSIEDVPMIYEVAHITDTEVHFVSKSLPDIRFAWNENRSNKGGFKESDLRKKIEQVFMPLLPNDLQEIISERELIQIIDGKEEKYTGKIWLPTEYEVFGDAYWNDDAEGEHFELFKDPANRVKCVAGTTARAYWWLASVCSGHSTSACLVGNSGHADGSGVTYEWRVPVCFTIHK